MSATSDLCQVPGRYLPETVAMFPLSSSSSSSTTLSYDDDTAFTCGLLLDTMSNMETGSSYNPCDEQVFQDNLESFYSSTDIGIVTAETVATVWDQCCFDGYSICNSGTAPQIHSDICRDPEVFVPDQSIYTDPSSGSSSTWIVNGTTRAVTCDFLAWSVADYSDPGQTYNPCDRTTFLDGISDFTLITSSSTSIDDEKIAEVWDQCCTDDLSVCNTDPTAAPTAAPTEPVGLAGVCVDPTKYNPDVGVELDGYTAESSASLTWSTTLNPGSPPTCGWLMSTFSELTDGSVYDPCNQDDFVAAVYSEFSMTGPLFTQDYIASVWDQCCTDGVSICSDMSVDSGSMISLSATALAASMVANNIMY